MSLRDSLLSSVAPSLFPGMRLATWLKLLKDNSFSIDARYWTRAVSVTAFSILTSAIETVESFRFDSSLQQVKIDPPLFILGHWRSGTTLLQNLMALDHRFASPTLHEVLFPHTFLSTETLLSPILGRLLPHKRYTDNVVFGLNVPYEDEFAICTISLLSPLISFVFPNQEKYNRFLTLRDVSEAELGEWKAAILYFLRKATYKHRRPLLLKSPTHTARIRRILQIFPTAKFIHVYRNPYHVFQSTVRTASDSSRRQRFQVPRLESIENRVIRVYKEMHDAYFDDRPLLSDVNLYELRFEELKQNPSEQLRRAYERLRLPEFDAIRHAISRYASTVTRYEQNTYPPIETVVRQRLAQEWKKSFENWGYDT